MVSVTELLPAGVYHRITWGVDSQCLVSRSRGFGSLNY